jgi:hypothetical protein
MNIKSKILTTLLLSISVLLCKSQNKLQLVNSQVTCNVELRYERDTLIELITIENNDLNKGFIMIRISDNSNNYQCNLQGDTLNIITTVGLFTPLMFPKPNIVLSNFKILNPKQAYSYILKRKFTNYTQANVVCSNLKLDYFYYPKALNEIKASNYIKKCNWSEIRTYTDRLK